MCHQPRVREPVLTVGGDDVEITSRRWGPHHSTQAAILAGTGGYEVPGSVPYVKQFVHKTLIDDSCVTCHMATAFGDKIGGHTMKMAHDSDTVNVSGCVFCHADIETFDLNGTQTEIAGLLDELKALLIANNLIDNSGLAVPGIRSSDETGSLFNYLLILEDGSLGVHNPRYSRAILQNSIEALR
ncbi:hypothetical protein GF312_10725 [Candidatus Poribacteria bacterium]|nr:hypothetical protein [Candidatus Poribacteria bacterium]